MSKAADMLGMSRAMVTRYLAEMENWAGVRLLNRTTRSLTLTSAGEAVLTQSRELLSLATAIARPVVTEDEAVSGLVRVTCAQSLAMVALSKALVQFRPAIRLLLSMCRSQTRRSVWWRSALIWGSASPTISNQT